MKTEEVANALSEALDADLVEVTDTFAMNCGQTLSYLPTCAVQSGRYRKLSNWAPIEPAIPSLRSQGLLRMVGRFR